MNKNIKHTIILFLALMAFGFTGCASKQVLSNAGKSGPIKVTVGSYLTITEIDGQPVKFKQSFYLEPGVHDLYIKFVKNTLDYRKSGSFTKTVNVFDGKEYELRTIESTDGTETFVVLRDKDLQKITDTVQTVGALEDPETSDGNRIRAIKYYPDNREFEIVGEYEIALIGGVFATKSLTPDRAMRYLRELAYKDNIDAFVDTWATRRFSGTYANAIGIRYIGDAPEKEKADPELLSAMLNYVKAVLDNTADDSTKMVTLMSESKTITYLSDMRVLITEGGEIKRGHIGFVTNIENPVGYVYAMLDDGTLTKDQFVDVGNKQSDCRWKILSCDTKTVQMEVIEPAEDKGKIETYLISVIE